jgi:hypothetical protein
VRRYDYALPTALRVMAFTCLLWDDFVVQGDATIGERMVVFIVFFAWADVVERLNDLREERKL